MLRYVYLNTSTSSVLYIFANNLYKNAENFFRKQQNQSLAIFKIYPLPHFSSVFARVSFIILSIIYIALKD